MLKKLTTKNVTQEQLDKSELRAVTGGAVPCTPRYCRPDCGFNPEVFADVLTLSYYD